MNAEIELRIKELKKEESSKQNRNRNSNETEVTKEKLVMFRRNMTTNMFTIFKKLSKLYEIVSYAYTYENIYFNTHINPYKQVNLPCPLIFRFTHIPIQI